MEKIDFGDGPVAGKLRAMELLRKYIGLFLPKKAREVEKSADDILVGIYSRIEVI